MTRKLFEIGGIVAAAVLIAFGIAAIVMSVNGHSTVSNSLKQEQITGTPDMTPTAIAPEVKADQAAQDKLFAQLNAASVKMTPSPIETPSCSVAGQLVDTGSEARCFAQYMRIHTLEATGGLTYAQMGRYGTADGKPIGTNDPTQAVQKNGQPVANGARDIWVTETALTTALNVSYMATQLSLFSIVVGVALLLAGIGFIVLDWAALHKRREAEAAEAKTSSLKAPTPAVA
jgi:uncharacterized iron-regulated membrane protein